MVKRLAELTPGDLIRRRTQRHKPVYVTFSAREYVWLVGLAVLTRKKPATLARDIILSTLAEYEANHPGELVAAARKWIEK